MNEIVPVQMPGDIFSIFLMGDPFHVALNWLLELGMVGCQINVAALYSATSITTVGFEGSDGVSRIIVTPDVGAKLMMKAPWA